MANYNLNIAKGRFVEFMFRVKNNDPANSAIILVPLSATDTEANAQDFDDLSAFLGGTPNEQTTGGWVRKTLTDAELATPAVDDTNNRFPAALPTVTWTGPSTNTVALAICYDNDTTSGTDSNIIVITVCDFVVTGDSNDVVLNPGDYNRAA
jgi:hypothetical protein